MAANLFEGDIPACFRSRSNCAAWYQYSHEVLGPTSCKPVGKVSHPCPVTFLETGKCSADNFPSVFSTLQLLAHCLDGARARTLQMSVVDTEHMVDTNPRESPTVIFVA